MHSWEHENCNPDFDCSMKSCSPNLFRERHELIEKLNYLSKPNAAIAAKVTLINFGWLVNASIDELTAGRNYEFSIFSFYFLFKISI